MTLCWKWPNPKLTKKRDVKGGFSIYFISTSYLKITTLLVLPTHEFFQQHTSLVQGDMSLPFFFRSSVTLILFNFVFPLFFLNFKFFSIINNTLNSNLTFVFLRLRFLCCRFTMNIHLQYSSQGSVFGSHFVIWLHQSIHFYFPHFTFGFVSYDVLGILT